MPLDAMVGVVVAEETKPAMGWAGRRLGGGDLEAATWRQRAVGRWAPGVSFAEPALEGSY